MFCHIKLWNRPSSLSDFVISSRLRIGWLCVQIRCGVLLAQWCVTLCVRPCVPQRAAVWCCSVVRDVVRVHPGVPQRAAAGELARQVRRVLHPDDGHPVYDLEQRARHRLQSRLRHVPQRDRCGTSSSRVSIAVPFVNGRPVCQWPSLNEIAVIRRQPVCQ